MSEAKWCGCARPYGGTKGDGYRWVPVDFGDSPSGPPRPERVVVESRYSAQVSCPQCHGTGRAQADTLERLAREWRNARAFADFDAAEWIAGLITAPDDWSRPREFAKQWAPRATGDLVARTEAFIERERARRQAEATAAQCFINGRAVTDEEYAAFAISGIPPKPSVIINVRGHMATHGEVAEKVRESLELRAARQRIAELERHMHSVFANAILPRDRDFDALITHVRALGRENEAAIPAARRAEALVADLRAALDDVASARRPLPTDGIAARVPAEPVGMASDGEEVSKIVARGVPGASRFVVGEWCALVRGADGGLYVTTERPPPDPNAERMRVVAVTGDTVTLESVDANGGQGDAGE